MTTRLARAAGMAPLAAATALAVLLTGCGRVSPPSARSTLSPASMPVEAPSSTAPDSSPIVSAAASGAPSSGPDTSADLAQIRADEDGIDAASNQSDADLNAGVSAQAQNDDP